MSREELDKVAEKLRPFLKEVLGEKRIDMVYVMLTDILEESSRVIFEGMMQAGSLQMHLKEKKMKMASS